MIVTNLAIDEIIGEGTSGFDIMTVDATYDIDEMIVTNLVIWLCALCKFSSSNDRILSHILISYYFHIDFFS